MDEWDALARAVKAAQWSPCQKSQRGVIIWRRSGGVISEGWNAPPAGQTCDGSVGCRANCNKRCVHAEVAALHNAHRWGKATNASEMLHVKVVDGEAVTSGNPSCWQCSRHLLGSGIEGMWLLHDGPVVSDAVLRRYTVDEFHTLTLQHCGSYPYEPEEV